MISFIVPAYNEERELPASLRSIRAAAEAAGQPYEIIVVDDNSDDATGEIAAAAGARVLRVRCRQIAAVRNAGARVARGDIFFFIDADTHVEPMHIASALKALARGDIGGSARFALDSDLPLWARMFLGLFCTIYFAANLGVGAFLFMRRESFAAVGGFDEQYFAGEEMYLTMALKKLGRFTVLRQPIITSARKVRMHSGAHVLRQWIAIFLGGKRILRGRDNLHLWYDGCREQSALFDENEPVAQSSLALAEADSSSTLPTSLWQKAVTRWT